AQDKQTMSFSNDMFSSAPFRCLGYNGKYYFYLPNGTKQVIELTAKDHQKIPLTAIAQIQWWEETFGNNGPTDWLAAANALFRKSERVGVYNPRLRRGRGAWFDDDRVVLHLGDHLLIDGSPSSIHGIKSKYIYEAAPASEYDDVPPLKNTESEEVIKIMELLAWNAPVSATLLAGWCAIAPICGALVWRPHCFITGESGNGKSWVINNIISPLIGNAAVKIKGNTSEAAIRRSLHIDALPVVFDEAKRSSSQNAKERMQAVLELARAGSSDSDDTIRLANQSGGVDEFIIRSSFLFGAVAAPIKLGEDDNRITPLELNKHKHDKTERFQALDDKAKAILSPEYCAKFRSRSINLIRVIRKNHKIFAEAGAKLFKERRAGDQIGALLAGAYSLKSSKIVTPQFAEDWIDSQDWGFHTENKLESDQRRCINHLLEHAVLVEIDGRPRQRNISFIIKTLREKYRHENMNEEEIKSLYDIQLSFREAEEITGVYGIKVIPGDLLLIANTHSQLAKIYKDTDWPVKWNDVMRRLYGTVQYDPQRYGGKLSRGLAIPLSVVFCECDENGNTRK
ncbi:MAG: hypothetical protein RBT43_05830, partial [bacterium]|nr:hypothetical protein [bacterium]